MNRRPVLEPRTQEHVDVWVRWPFMAAVLVDREDALHVSGGAPEGPLRCITDCPLRSRAVQPGEAFRGAVVDRQDEAEIDRS